MTGDAQSIHDHDGVHLGSASVESFAGLKASSDAHLQPSGSPSEFSFEDIADQFDLYLCTASTSHQSAKNTSIKLRESYSEINRLQKIIQQLRSENGGLRGTNSKLKKDNENLHKLNDSRKASARNHENEIRVLKQLVDRTEKRYENTMIEYERLQEHTLKLGEKMQDAQLNLELLECTTTPGNPQSLAPQSQNAAAHIPLDLQPASMQLLAQPFVVVLVDGDAYHWAHNLFSKPPVRNPGALAAIRLKNEVTKYILENEIPQSSKVIARVYINESGIITQPRQRVSFKKHQQNLLASFRIQFTEALPLFDFVDVGHGKERADEKIRENFHLLLSNPHCHRIFLAACTDNGFARMLEQYQYHTAAYEKIVLVSPGYVESEIARLGFKEVIWPSVFLKKEPSSPSVKDQNRRAASEKSRLEAAIHNTKIGLVGLKDERVAGLVLDTMKAKWDGNHAGVGQIARLGLRMLAVSWQSQRDSGNTNIEESNDSEWEDVLD